MWRIRLAVLAYICTIVGWTSAGINGGWIHGDDIIDQTLQGILEGLLVGIFPGAICGLIGVIFDDDLKNPGGAKPPGRANESKTDN